VTDAAEPLVHVRRLVDERLAAHLDSLSRELAPLGQACEPMVESLGAALTGGKRLRAGFCLWSWRAHAELSGDDSADEERAVRVGAALELFHAAALVHDDVMDASDTRRGRPSTHREFEARHRASGWSGDAVRFGQSGAILLGDLALVTSERELTAAISDLDPVRRGQVRTIFDEMRVEVTAGQYLDVLAEVSPWGDPDQDERRTVTVVRAKSARYSVEHPLTLGAALAGADADGLARMRRVGLPLGEAFQLRDDLLGVFGDPATTGKPAGDDLREGKRTLLVVLAMAGTDAGGARLLRDGLGRPNLSEAEIAELRQVLRSSGAVEEIERRIHALAEPALAELAVAPLAEPARSVLVELGRAAVHRLA
jgi:geranylgeranyl diphosphate synthase type I